MVYLNPEELKKYAEQKLSYREMGKIFGVHYNTVKAHMVKHGIPTGRPKGTPPKPYDSEHSYCNKCNKVVRNDAFPYVINRSDGRRLSYCRACRSKQGRDAINRNPKSYWQEREGRIRKRCEHKDIPFDLPKGYLLELWNEQEGKCFYTGTTLELKTRRDRKTLPSAPSVDRVDVARGYTVGNIVICSARANSIKYDQTLNELKLWMPSWYQKVVDMWRAKGLDCFQVAEGDF